MRQSVKPQHTQAVQALTDAEGASIWRGERCVHYLGADGKGRTMPLKTEGIVEGVAPEVLLADLTRIDG